MNDLGKIGDQVPLVVDVDGTLLRTDILHEQFLQFVATRPLESWRLIGWTMAGKAQLKSTLATNVDGNLDTVPLVDEVLALIETAKKEGRPVYLASASDRRHVDELARRIGGVAGVFASDGRLNLSGEAKAGALVGEFGENGFDYAGNCKADYPVWQKARKAYVVSGNHRFHRRAVRDFPGAEAVSRPSGSLRSYFRALRTHQWAKNVLVFLPTIAGHRFDYASLKNTYLAFFCFCLAASSAYIINDLLDLPADRAHATKRNRPFASGAIPVAHGPFMAAILLAAAVAIGWFLSGEFLAVLGAYVCLTLAYSIDLKRRVLIDVVVLGMLYTLRVLGGVAAVSVAQSPWLLMFSLFLFLALAVVKRCAELVPARALGKAALKGRGYVVEDLSVLVSLGAASGVGAVLVVGLYIFSPEVQKLYTRPEWLWLICPLILYWISRMILIAHRGTLHEDPVVFALTDRVSWYAAALTAAIILIAT
jgi:4-hydroxybenzoate polyprenyltransferase